MTSQVFVDDILHAFVSEGNLHLVLGIVNGNVDEAGNDLRTSVTTLIIPNSRASVFTNSLEKALSILLAPVNASEKNEVLEPPKEKVEFLGQGIRLPK
jgi:hypothetical protein